MADALDEDQIDTPPPKSNRTLLIMGLMTAAWVGAGAGMYFSSQHNGGSGGHGGGAEGATATAAHEEAPAAGGDETIVTMSSFVANLTPDVDAEMHYLKCTLAVALTGASAEKAFEQRTPKVRNQVIMYLSSLKNSDIQGIENKRKLVAHLLELVTEATGPHVVSDLYLTEFIVQ